jgi:hypothetical protein
VAVLDQSPYGTRAPGGLYEGSTTAIDALEIDFEGAEEPVLFLRDAPRSLLPEPIVIEDMRGFWRTDVFALLEQHGYTVRARSHHNVALRRNDQR